MNRYQFEKVIRDMKNLFGGIHKGQEGEYEDYLNILERHLYEIFEKRDINGRQMMEVLQCVLWDVKGCIDKTEYDYSKWVEPASREYADEIESLFMPEKNGELKEMLISSIDTMDTDARKEYFTLSVKCMIRVYESVEMWTKERGADGYYKFISQFVGNVVFLRKYNFLVPDNYFE